MFEILASVQYQYFQDDAQKKQIGLNEAQKNTNLSNLFAGWWLTYPSEKYESQLG